MIHELREYEFLEADWPEYRRLFIDVARRVRGDEYGRLLAAWEEFSQDAVENDKAPIYVRFAHLWEYKSLDSRAELRKQLSQVSGWIKEFLPSAAPLILRQSLSVLNPLDGFHGIEQLAGKSIYLHRARVAVGKVGQAIAHAQTLADTVWSTEFPDPNEVAWLTGAIDSAILDGASIKILSHRVNKLVPLSRDNPTLIHR